MTGRGIACLLHNCVVLSFCPKPQDPPSVVPDWRLPQSPSEARTAFHQHSTHPCPHKGRDRPLHIPFPSDLLMTKLMLLQEGGKLAPLWSHSMNMHMHNTRHADLIYTSASLFSQSWEKEWCVNEELVCRRWGWVCFDWLCLIKQSKSDEMCLLPPSLPGA